MSPSSYSGQGGKRPDFGHWGQNSSWPWGDCVIGTGDGPYGRVKGELQRLLKLIIGDTSHVELLAGVPRLIGVGVWEKVLIGGDS